jgi:hypothetical protein
MNLNSFDNAKIATSKDSTFAQVGITVANYWRPTIDSSSKNYYVKLDKNVFYPLAFFRMRIPITPNIEAGGELSTTIGSFGIKLFAKLALLQQPHSFYLSVIPSAGFGYTTDSIFLSDAFSLRMETPYNSYFHTSLSFPFTYEFNDETAITFTPQLFYVYQSVNYNGYNLENSSSSLFSSAYTLGIDIKRFHPAFTLVDMKNGRWLPLIGILYTPK